MLNRFKTPVFIYFAFQFWFSLLWWVPIFYEYQKHFGLTSSEIFAIQSLYYAAFCLLEIPTGFLADKMGYLRSMKLGAGTLVISQVLPIFWTSYNGFLTHFLLLALARSLVSGAGSSYLYWLNNSYFKLYSSNYEKLEGLARAGSLWGRVLSWSVVGVLMSLQFTLPYWLSTFSAVMALAVVLYLPQETIYSSIENESFNKPENSPETKPSYFFFQTIRNYISLKNISPILFFFILQGVVLFVLGRIIQVNLFQPLLNQVQIPILYHGIIMSAMTLFEAMASTYPHHIFYHLENKIKLFFSDAQKIYLVSLISLLACGLAIFTNPLATLLLLCISAIAFGIGYPIQKRLINDEITKLGLNNKRATLLSVESIIDRAFASLFALAIASTTLSLQYIMLTLSILGSIFFILLHCRFNVSLRPNTPLK